MNMGHFHSLRPYLGVVKKEIPIKPLCVCVCVWAGRGGMPGDQNMPTVDSLLTHQLGYGNFTTVKQLRLKFPIYMLDQKGKYELHNGIKNKT